MPSASITCFVDANVLVYSVNPAEPLKRAVAEDLLERLWREQRLCTSVQVLNEFYSVVTRRLTHVVAPEKAWGKVEEFLQWNPLPIDFAVLARARGIEQRYKLNWWDCLILAAASAQGCALLYTEDLQHGATLDGVKVVNPFIAQVQQEPAPYRAAVISPHRPRGRPRKQAVSA
jgi:predicted nucleic acid-binding protein